MTCCERTYAEVERLRSVEVDLMRALYGLLPKETAGAVLDECARLQAERRQLTTKAATETVAKT